MLTTKRSAVVLGVVLLGCTAGSDGGIASVTAPQPQFAKSAVQQQVTGHATILLRNFGSAEQKYSNSAIRHADGTVSGQFQLKTEQEDGGSVHGSVVCFTIDASGKTARLVGRVEKSTIPLVDDGALLVWKIADNGEGKNDPPDAASDVFLASPAGAAFHCAVGFNFFLYPIESGNLQIHQ